MVIRLLYKKKITQTQHFFFWRLIDDYAKDGGKELFTKMHCVRIKNS